MKEEIVHLPETQSREIFMHLVKGKVFHMTTAVTAQKIVESGEILANTHGERSGPYGGTNSYFRSKHCVSLFDYRATDFPDWEFYSTQCYPLQGMTEARPYAVFMLSPSAYHRLIPWTLWKDEGSTLRIVAHIEIGYPDRIPLSEIDAMVTIHRPDAKDGPWARLERILKDQRQKR